MTQTIDNIMIKAGFDADDVKEVRFRPMLYAGIAVMLSLSGLFLALLVL